MTWEDTGGLHRDVLALFLDTESLPHTLSDATDMGLL